MFSKLRILLFLSNADASVRTKFAKAMPGVGIDVVTDLDTALSKLSGGRASEYSAIIYILKGHATEDESYIRYKIRRVLDASSSEYWLRDDRDGLEDASTHWQSDETRPLLLEIHYYAHIERCAELIRKYLASELYEFSLDGNSGQSGSDGQRDTSERAVEYIASLLRRISSYWPYIPLSTPAIGCNTQPADSSNRISLAGFGPYPTRRGFTRGFSIL